MSEFSSWEELRFLLLEPSMGNFTQILALLANPRVEDSLIAAIEYASQHLASWDDELREGWLHEFWETYPHKEPHPVVSLVRSLRTKKMELSAEEFQHFFNTKHLHHIAHLHMDDELPPYGCDLDKLLYKSPWIKSLTRLSFTNVRIRAGTIIGRSPHSKRITHLNLSANSDDYFGGTGVRTIAESPHLTNLTHLSLSNAGIWGDQLALLLCMEQLTHLDISSNSICNNIKPVLESTEQQLERLKTKRAKTTEESKEQAKPPAIASLQSLDLSSCYLKGASEAGQLIGLPSFSKLETLKLSWAVGDDAILKEIVTSPHTKHLKELILSYSSFGSEGARHLASSAHLSNLEVLKVDSCGIGDKGAVALAASPHLRLKALELRHNEIGDEGMLAIARSALIEKPKKWDISANQFGDRGLEGILSSMDLTDCCELLLGGNNITDRGAKQIAMSPDLVNLQMLSLGENAIGDETVFALLQSPYLTQLQTLILTFTEVTDVGLSALQKHRPAWEVLGV